MADQSLAQLVAAALQLRRQALPVDGALCQLSAHPAFQCRQFARAAEGQAQVEAGGRSSAFHQKHQQTITARHQAQRLQCRAWPLGPRDQAE